MIKSKKLIGMPVISLSEGQQIGKIKELVVDPKAKSIAALLIEQKGWFKDQKFIPYGKVCSVGDDAITIEQSANIQKGASLPEILQLTKDKYQVLSEKVVTENGKVLGLVEEYYVNISTGDIAGLEVSGSFINSLMSGRAFLDTALVRTVGKELIVTGNEAPDNLVKINGGFKETIKSIKNTGDNFWESTMSKTKKLTGSINKKLVELKKEKPEESPPCQCNACSQQPNIESIPLENPNVSDSGIIPEANQDINNGAENDHSENKNS